MKTNSLYDNVIHGLLFGRPSFVYGSWVEPDGRRRAKAIRDMIKEGWIGKIDDNPLGLEQYPINVEKVLGSVDPVEVAPDLRKFWSDNFGHDVKAIAWGNLSLSEKIYCVTHPDGFRWRWIDNFEREVYPAATLGNLARDVSDAYLSIETDESLALIATENLRRKAERALRANFQWAATKLGILDADTAVKVSLHAGRGFFGDPNPAAPDEWGKAADESVQALRDRIAADTQSLERLHELQKKVALYGGWHKFVADAREAITAVIAKEDGDKSEAA